MKENKNKEVKVKETTKEIDKDFKDVAKDAKKNSRLWAIIGNVAFWVVIALFMVIAITGFLNFKKVENNQEPTLYTKQNSYVVEDKNVTVYNYFVYKIVKINSNEGLKVSLKLWFLKDFEETK